MISVLIVDDDVRVARTHKELIDTITGFEVVGLAHSAQEAVSAARRTQPDLVLLDLFLPDRSGLEVLTELRGPGAQTSGSLPDVVVVTALRNVEHVRAALRGGAVYYLLKPFPLSALREQLERYAIAQKKLTRMDTATQADVDGVLDLLRPRSSSALPKGLTSTTAALVANTLRDAGGELSAVEVAERTGISRVTARRYLEHHCVEGRVELRMRYGSAGRPEHLFRWRS